MQGEEHAEGKRQNKKKRWQKPREGEREGGGDDDEGVRRGAWLCARGKPTAQRTLEGRRRLIASLDTDSRACAWLLLLVRRGCPQHTRDGVCVFALFVATTTPSSSSSSSSRRRRRRSGFSVQVTTASSRIALFIPGLFRTSGRVVGLVSECRTCVIARVIRLKATFKLRTTCFSFVGCVLCGNDNS